jgi:tetratricopeptide (TPR) repeat protein
LLVTACSRALDDPSPVSTFATGSAHGRTPAQLVADADAAWARRAQAGQAEAAQGMYVEAANADEHRVDALIGAMRALTFRIEYEPGVSKKDLASEEVQLGQWCQRRAPSNAECDYRLAIALGQQARERPATGRDAMGKMVDLLHHAIDASPKLDAGGAHRVLAMLLLRAPGWPIGPGDNEAALEEARAAVEVAPDSIGNQLALGEALAANDHADEALAAYRRAAALAQAAHADPEVAHQLADAQAGISKNGG